jgi:para-aminobenzoate synthetase component 1
MKSKVIKWQNPTIFAKKISDNYLNKDWCFLYSGLNRQVKNSHSYISLFPEKKIKTNNFSNLEKIIKKSELFFGYLAYELANEFENLPKTKKSFINLPKIWLNNFGLIFEFNHEKEILTAFFSDEKKLKKVLSYTKKQEKFLGIKIKKINSNFSDQSYIKTIKKIKRMIENGDFYQTNLTRKFFGNFSRKLKQKESFQIFSKLCKKSPANYSSFLKLDNNFIISSSPELFLKINCQNQVISRPIKGTSPRFLDKKSDQESKIKLKNSQKERAENLMIVDLVRNDLSKFCKAGTVKVKNLFKINSYKNIHHMSSEVVGLFDRKKFTILDAFKNCFPAGSMTGAPKVKSMEMIASLEKIKRGVYSGAIGFLNKDEINLSVVIRTIILSEDKFEFQVGGAITFDSNPEEELKEIFYKASAINNVLFVN